MGRTEGGNEDECWALTAVVMDVKEQYMEQKNNCPEVVCEQRRDGTRTLGAGEEQKMGVGRASSLLLVPHVRSGEQAYSKAGWGGGCHRDHGPHVDQRWPFSQSEGRVGWQLLYSPALLHPGGLPNLVWELGKVKKEKCMGSPLGDRGYWGALLVG